MPYVGPTFKISTSTNESLKTKFLLAIGHDPTAQISMRNGLDYDGFCRLLLEHDLNVLAKEEVFRLFDFNESNTIDYFEFFSVLSSFREIVDNDPEHLCKFYFELFDYDGSETVSREEFEAIMTQFLVNSDGSSILSQHEMTEMFQLMDNSRDGFVQYDEFRGWFIEMMRVRSQPDESEGER